MLNNRGCGKKNVKKALLSKVLGLVSLIAGAAVLLDVIDERVCGVHPYFEQAGLKYFLVVSVVLLWWKSERSNLEKNKTKLRGRVEVSMMKILGRGR